MPMPCPGVLNDILDLYFIKKEYDESQSTLKSWKGSAQRLVGTISNYVKPIVNFNDPYSIQIQQAHARFKIEFRGAETIVDWIRIIQRLADAAKRVKPEETITGRADACDIYHMARTYILKTLTSENDKSFGEFNDELNKLIQMRDKFDKDINYKRNHTYSIGVGPIKTDLEETLTKLAYLGDSDSTFRVIDRRLFAHLVILIGNEKVKLTDLDRDVFEGYNEELPYCLQSKFYKMYYREIFQKILTYSFSDFESKAKIKYQNELIAEKERKEKNVIDEKLKALDETQILSDYPVNKTEPVSSNNPIVNEAESGDEFQAVEAEVPSPSSSRSPLNYSSTLFPPINKIPSISNQPSDPSSKLESTSH